MPALIRQIVTTIAMIALVSGILRERPCLDDDECAKSCASAAALTCPESSGHHDPPVAVHSCDCMCHVPGVTTVGTVNVRPASHVQLGAVPVREALSTGYLDSLFRPPRA